MSKHFLEDMVLEKRARNGVETIKRTKKASPITELRPKERGQIKETEIKNVSDVRKITETDLVYTINRKEPEMREVGKMREVTETDINYTKKKSRYLLWFLALVSVIFCFFAVSFLFAKAEVLINPKIQNIVLNENLSASKDSSNGGFAFNLVVIPGQEDKTIQATGQKDVKIPATGTAIIYNAFSSAPQALNIDTRLEGSNGKIYKTQTKITVPGMSKSGTPGSVEVGIYGSVPGVEYNSDPLDFKIFGFKGTPKYTKIYARSSGSITGGYVGKAPDVADVDKTTALVDLKTSLQAKLLQQATNQTPDGFILFKDAVFVNADDSNISSVYNKDNSVTFTENGTLYGILLNEQDLTKKIATDNVNKYNGDGSDIYLPNIKDLVFSLSNKDNTSFTDIQNINFNLSGSSKIVWRLDVNKFTNDLLGKSKSDFTQILAKYPNIDSATLKLSPVWKMTIPDKLKSIKVTVNYPQ